MTIGSGLRAPPSTLGSIAKSKTPEGTPPSKGKEKVEEVNAVTYKDDGEVLFTSSFPTSLLVAVDK